MPIISKVRKAPIISKVRIEPIIVRLHHITIYPKAIGIYSEQSTAHIFLKYILYILPVCM